MTKRIINTNIEQHLVANEPFEYAHLVKFERPFAPKNGEFRTNANRYVYLTDASRDITFHGNTYIANRIQAVGGYSETIDAKATNMSLTLSGEPLGLSYTVTGNLSTGSFAGVGYSGDDATDFVKAGFIEGDKVKISLAAGGNFSDGDSSKKFIISGFTNNNQTISLERTGTDDDDSAFVSLSSTALKFELDSEEINSATLSSGGALPGFVNREVFIYKVFFDTDDLSTPIGAGSPSTETDNSILVFKGIISSTNIQEATNSSRVQWNLTSHWGDFQEVAGRITTDEIHRALDASGLPNPNATFRPIHATDLGFAHAESSLNTIATYQTSETRYKYKVKKKWGGFRTKVKEQPYEHIENHEVDLNVYLSGKYLPVIYGVQRTAGIPVFADTANNNSKEVYVAYAISEGENHGIFNLYIDGAPLLCVDENDTNSRGVNTANSQNEALQCYGRMDRGDTLGGATLSGSEVLVGDDEDYGGYDDYVDSRRGYDEYYGQTANANSYNSVTEPAAGSNTLASNIANAEGLQHEETASINHPYDIHFTFHSGRHDQKANNILVSKAASNGFLRQNQYYESTNQYWGPNHRLLDTAYAVMKFTIDADATTVPEVEYVVKGKVLENYNYDGTYVHDGFLGASDNHANFKEGDTVTIEFSTDDPQDSSRSWTALSGNFRILDKYNFTTSRGTTHYRFRLDTIPDLALDSNGIPTRKYIRLKSGSNYWHMMTYNADLVSTATAYPHTTNRITPNSMSTNSQGQLQAVLSSTEQSRLYAFFGSSGLTGNTTPIYMSFSGSGFTGKFANLPKTKLRATYNASNNTLTFLNTHYSANQTLSGTLYIQPALKHLFSFSNLTEAEADYYAIGSMLEIVETGEKREIVNWTSGYAQISSPFVTTPTADHTFKITGKGRDLRSSSNPAIQTMDLLTNTFYGKGLSEVTEVDLNSIKASARLCDARSDVTLNVSTATVKQGDIYKLVDGSNNHIASGKVLSDVTSGTSITFTEVSGKFMRAYQSYLDYAVGDIVYNAVGNVTRYYRVTSAGFKSTAPTHTTGTTNGFLYLSAVTLTKESGNASSPATLTLEDGAVPQYSLYDSDFVKYWRYLGWEENRQWCVTRHQTNGSLDTSKSVFANINGLLSHYNGILSYSNGKYVLGVETQENAPVSSNTFNSVTYDWNVNPEYIDESDIIGTINLNDNSQKNSKNTIKGSIFDPQNNFGSRSITFFNSDFLKADRNTIKTGNMSVPAITSYYNARMTIEKALIESRFSKEISFTVGPKGLLLKPGEVISVTYAPFGFENKRFRIKNLNFNQNCNVSIKATEYDDSMYIISPQRAIKAHRANLAQKDGVEVPNSPSSVATTNTKPGVIRVTWTNATNYKEGSDFTQIWRAGSQGSSGDITSHATLVATVDNTTEYNDSLGNAGDFYYWVRHVRDTPRKLDGAITRLSGNFSTAINAGVEGTAKTASAQLDVDITAAQIKFNSSGNLVGSNATDQDVTFTASLRNLTPDSNGVVFSVVNVDLSSQTTQKVYPVGNQAGAAASISDTSAPYKAVLDASTFTSTTDNKFLKVTVTSTEGDTFTEVIPITVTQDGSSGSVGVDAAAVSLTASADVIVYDANDPDAENPSGQSIVFTATGLGTSGSNSPFSGTPTYTFSIDGGSEVAATTTTGTSSATFTLPDSDEPSANSTKTITVFLRDGSGGTLKASDSMSIFGIKSGSDALNAFLSNEAHTVIANSSGTVSSFTGAGGTFNVKIGGTDITESCTYSIVGTPTGGTATIAAGTGTGSGVYSVSAMSADVCTAVFRATIPSSVSPTGAQITIDRTFTVTKSKAGTDGDDGLQVAQVQIYKRTTTNSAPTVPADNETYNFNSGAITSTPISNGWTEAVPGGSGQYLWTCKATASANAGTATDTITAGLTSASGDWSTPVIQSEAQTPRTHRKIAFYDAWVRGTLPTFSTTGVTYNFTTRTLGNLPAGWSNSVGTMPYAYAILEITEAGYEGTKTITVEDIQGVSGYSRRNEDDFELEFDDTNHRLNYRFADSGSFLTSTSSTIPAKYKNDSISIDFVGDDPRLTKYSGETVTASTPSGLKNATINIDTDGVLTGTGASNIKVNNAKTTFSELQGTKPPADANKVDIVAGTDGNISVNVNGAGASNIAVYSTAEKTKINRLQAGQLPDNASLSLESTTGSQTKATAAENAAKLQESTNRFTLTTADTTADDGIFKFQIGGGTVTSYDVLSSDSKTRFDRLRQGQDPTDATKSIQNNDISISSGAISGIGTGSGAVVDNSEISVSLPTTGANQGVLSITRGGSLANLTATFDLANLKDTGSVRDGAARARNVIDTSNRITGSFYDAANNLLRTPAQIIDRTDRANAAIDSSNRIIGNIFDGTNERTIGNIASAIDGSGRIVGSIFSGGTSFTPAELINVRSTFISIDNSSNIKFNPDKVPLNDTFLQVDNNEIKIKDQAIDTAQIKNDAIEGSKINSSTTITAGSSNNVAVLDGANSTYRIYAGHATATSAPFQVKQTGEVNVTSFNVNTGTSEKTIRFRPADPTNIFFAVGDSDPTDAPLRVKSVSNVSQVEIDNLKLYKDDGTTLMFDSSVGFTDAAFTQIAANVGSSNAGSTVTTVDNSNLINPFTSIGGSTASTTAGSQARFQKVTLFAPTTITVKAIKDANFFKTGSTISDALGKIPSVVKMRIGVSENSDLSNPDYIAELGQSNTDGQNTNSNIGNGVTRITSGTPTSTQYEITTVTESEPGFQISISSLVDQSGDAVNDSDNFEISDTRQYSGSQSGTDYYFFIEVTGTISQSQSGGASDVSASAGRELVLTASGGGSFSVDSDGNVQPSGGGTNIQSISAGNLIDVSGSGSSRTVSVDLSELTDMTESWATGSDEFVVLDSGVQKRKLSSEIFGSNAFNSTTIPTNTNQLTNGAGFTTNTGTVTEAFKTIVVSGQSNVVADSATDQLTIVAGSNMTITTNASNDTITFASTASGGLPSGMTYSSSVLDVTGQIRATGDVVAFHSSDYRLKDNVSTIENALDKVDQIRGVEFDWNEKSDYQEFGHDIGVIAQEVEKAVPEIVIDRDDGYKAVNYQKLTALLIEAVKELKQEIKELKKDK